tara:strand:+ start:962 stop:1075 length:114 start_codon:yes stop_codon:yes gene_type:complete
MLGFINIAEETFENKFFEESAVTTLPTHQPAQKRKDY